jgi:hypothetical protein
MNPTGQLPVVTVFVVFVSGGKPCGLAGFFRIYGKFGGLSPREHCPCPWVHHS